MCGPNYGKKGAGTRSESLSSVRILARNAVRCRKNWRCARNFIGISSRRRNDHITSLLLIVYKSLFSFNLIQILK